MDMKISTLIGIVLTATAMRRFGDLGPLIGESSYYALLLIGGTLVAVSAKTRTVPSLEWPGWLTATGALIALWCAFVAEPAAVLLAIVGASAHIAHRSARWQKHSSRLFLLALTLVVTWGATRSADALALMRVDLSTFASSFTLLLRMIGVDADAGGALVVFPGMTSDLSLLMTPFTLGLSVHGAIAAIAALFLWSGGGAARSFWRPGAYLISATFLRVLLVCVLSALLEIAQDYDEVHFPMDALLDWRYGLAVDIVVATVFSFLVIPVAPRAAANERRTPPLRLATLTAAAVVVGVLFASDRILDTMGSQKPGRIAIDEGHSLWEATDMALGRDNYGTESGYNFRVLVNWLESGYGTVRRLYDPITRPNLDSFDVFIVKTPTRRFTHQERKAISEWVAAGGGLVLIGDHTNVFGTSTVLNEIAEPFGFHYDFDCIFDHVKRYEQVYRTEAHLRSHPILAGMDFLRYEVGCSINIDSPRTRAVAVGRGIKSQPIDYRVSNFYPKPKDTLGLRVGSFPQVATRAFGSGRVVAISDSTLFSTFSLCTPGRREIVEGMIGYANRRDPGGWLRSLLNILAFGGLAALLFLLRGQPWILTTFLLVAVLGSARFSTTFAETILASAHPRPAAGIEGREVLFHRSNGVDWAVEEFIQDHEKTYDLFYQFVSRTGQFPRLVDDFDDCISSDAPLVLIDPDRRTEAELRALTESIKNGRNVILMESRENDVVTALCEKAGMTLTAQGASDVLATGLLTPSGPIDFKVAKPTTARQIEGGSAFLSERRLHPDATSFAAVVGAVSPLGHGHVAVITCGRRFANQEYGYSYSSIPDQGQRRLFEVQYQLLAAASHTEVSR